VEPARRRVRGPSATKHAAILDGARTLFLARGYAGTTIDDVAALAKVSKQTVYAHFSDKAQLFARLIERDIAESPSGRHPLVDTMAESDDPPGDLAAFARVHVADVIQPHLLRLRRMLMAEAERFPHLALAWYEAGPAFSTAMFATWFGTWHRRGVMRAPEPVIAAEHFNWLVLSIPLNRAMALPLDTPPFTSDELDRYANLGTRAFIDAYAVTRPGGSDTTAEPRDQ